MPNDPTQTPETRDQMLNAPDRMWTASPGDYDARSISGSDRLYMNQDGNNMTGNNNQSPNSNFGPSESPETVGNPQNNQEVYYGSFQAVLQNNLGYYVVIDFLIGTSEITSRSGILYAVGNNFVTLYEPDSNQYIVCDLFSVKFVTFYPGDYVPAGRNRNRVNGTMQNGMGTTNGYRRTY